MPYFILIEDQLNPSELFLDKVLGSGVFVGIHWESVARKLNLPIISSMFTRADSENGFAIEGNTLLEFEKELKEIYLYWLEKSEKSDVSEEIYVTEELLEEIESDGIVAGEKFIEDLKEIQKAVSFACLKNMKLIVG